MIDIIPELVIAGRPLPVLSYSVASGTYTACGHANVTLDRSVLERAGLDLISVAGNSPAFLPLDIFVRLGGVRTHLFGGEYLWGDWLYDSDCVRIYARDWAGPLVDQKRILPSQIGEAVVMLTPQVVPGKAVQTMNQAATSLVSQIAEMYGLTPEVENANQTISPVTKEPVAHGGQSFAAFDRMYAPTTSNVWDYLNRVARATGNIVYVTPDKKLVFSAPGAGLIPITVSYLQNPVPSGAMPCWDLEVRFNSRRNLSFQTIVLSYDHSTGQETTGTALVLGTNFSVGTKTIKAGIWTGAQVAQLVTILRGGIAAGELPVYTERHDGSTAEQAETLAVAMARDIAQRAYILSCRVDEAPDVRPLNVVYVDSPRVDKLFAARKFWINAYNHVFRTSRAGDGRAECYTELTAMDIPLMGSGDPILVGTKAPPGLGVDLSASSGVS